MGRARRSIWWWADDSNSMVSKILFPTEPGLEFTGFVVYYCIAKGDFLGKLPRHTECMVSHGNVGFRVVTVAGGGTDGRCDSLQVTTRGPECSSEWDAEGTKDDMKTYLRQASGCLPPGTWEILEHADVVQKWGMYQSQNKHSWISAQSRTTLLGDAAHAMCPFTGQGASSAIQDGHVLGELLSKVSLQGALRQYEAKRKRTCEKMIQQAKFRGQLITAHGLTRWSWDTLLPSIMHAMRSLQNEQKPIRWLAMAWIGFIMLLIIIIMQIDRDVDLFRPKTNMLTT